MLEMVELFEKLEKGTLMWIYLAHNVCIHFSGVIAVFRQCPGLKGVPTFFVVLCQNCIFRLTIRCAVLIKSCIGVILKLSEKQFIY